MNPFKNILVPTDFSPSSAAAVELALDMASRFDAELTLLHVWTLPVYPYMDLMLSTNELTKAVEQAAAECLEKALKEVRSRLPRAQSRNEMGIPWQQIIDVSKETRADLIIMGTHGRRGVQHALMGSVAEKIVRLSPVPVLTVRADATR